MRRRCLVMALVLVRAREVVVQAQVQVVEQGMAAGWRARWLMRLR